MVVYPWGGEVEDVSKLADQLDGFYVDTIQGKLP